MSAAIATGKAHAKREPDRFRRLVRASIDVATLLRDAGARWADDACYRLGSSLAYAALFSIFPLLLLAVTAVGFVLGGDATAHGRILRSVAGSTSPAVLSMLDQTLANMETHRAARGIGAVVGVAMLFLGAGGVFAELQASLNLIWRVKAPPSTGVLSAVLDALKVKLFSFAVVVGAALAILVLLAASTALAAVGGAADAMAGGKVLWQATEIGVSIGALSVLLASVYRLVPQTHVEWRHAFPGAVVAAFLFTGLKTLLAWYLGHIGSYAAYGAVGAVLGLLTWIYVASMLILYGAELSYVHAERAGNAPAPGATPARACATPTRASRPETP